MSYVHFTNLHWGLLRFLQSEGFQPKVWILVRNSHPRRWKVNWKAPEIGKLERWKYGWLNSDMILTGLTRIDVMVWHQHEDKWSYISRSSNLFVLALHRFVCWAIFWRTSTAWTCSHRQALWPTNRFGPRLILSILFLIHVWHMLAPNNKKERAVQMLHIILICLDVSYTSIIVYLPLETWRLLKYSILIFQPI